ncbi:MAG: hypothetical protein HUU43_10000 [Ignavibacteriaceae bacterium]|nr:hypothetical protein [Ignavibacteriaceae bacterium]NUM71171.1 hypothetical protein [Ignavibacteriaceae bacterium]
MGFSTLLDILGSMIIGAFLFVILLRMNDTATKNTYTYASESIVQQNLVTTITILENDFRKIGYCADWEKIADPGRAILSADTSSVTFLTDVFPYDGTVDTIRYYTGDTTSLRVTPNPRDRMLFRVVNKETPGGSNLGITQFKITYFNSLGTKIATPVAVPGEIHSMQIDITVESTAAYDNDYTTAYWRQIRLAAHNLTNR